jgi:hypothetical protein
MLPLVIVFGIVAMLTKWQGEALQKLSGLLDSLPPSSAEADGQASESVSVETRRTVSRLRPGMKAAAVEARLGPPTFARNDGTGRTASWIVGGDVITVRFRNGKLEEVSAEATPAFPFTDSPEAESDDQSAAQPSSSSGVAGGDEDLPPLLDDLSKKKKAHDAAIKRILREAESRR